MKQATYYLKKSIEITKESKKTITIDTSIVFDFPNDNELGKQIRKIIIDKLDSCDKHIEDMERLIKERIQ